MLAVVATLLFITHRTAKLKHLLVLPHSAATQTRQAVRTRALARILQGGIIVRSLSKPKRNAEYVEGLQIFKLTRREEGLRKPSKCKESWNKRNVDLQLSFSWKVTLSASISCTNRMVVTAPS